METPGETYLDYIGLPREHPRYFEVVAALDESLLDAAETTMDLQRRDDPSLSAMLDDRYVPWVAAVVEGSQVGVGMEVSVPDHYPFWLGKAQPNHSWARVKGLKCEYALHDRCVDLDGGRRAQAFDRAQVDVLLPVPFDLAPLVEEHQVRATA